MSVIIKKSARLIRHNLAILICIFVAGFFIWRGLTYNHGFTDLLTAGMCTALAFSLILTAIAASDRSVDDQG